MDYPLQVSLPAPLIGFAVANDAAEHAALSDAGYLPALSAEPAFDRAAAVAALEAKGVKVDGRWSDKRLAEELAKA